MVHWPNHSVSDKTLWLAPQLRASKLDLHFTLPWHRSEWTLCTNYSTLQPSSGVTNTYGDVCCEHLIQFLFILLLRFNTLSFYSKIQNSSAHRDNHDNQTEKLHGMMVYWDNSSTDDKVWYIDDWIYYNSFLIQCNAFNLIKYTDGYTGLSACCCQGKSHFAKFCLILNSAPLLSTTQS